MHFQINLIISISSLLFKITKIQNLQSSKLEDLKSFLNNAIVSLNLSLTLTQALCVVCSIQMIFFRFSVREQTTDRRQRAPDQYTPKSLIKPQKIKTKTPIETVSTENSMYNKEERKNRMR